MLTDNGQTNAERRRLFGRVNTFLLRFVPISAPTASLDEDRLRRGLITAAVACLFTAISVSYALLIWLFERPPPIYYGLAFEAFVTATSTLVLLRRGFLRAAPWVLLVGGTLAVLVPFLREGPSSQAACNFTIVIVMAALLVGWRGVLALGVPSVVLVLGAGILARRGLLHPTPPTAPRGVFALMQMSSLTVMLVIFDRVRLRILKAHRQLETRLLQAQRLEAVGRLAGGIAHDFNNLLTVILANVSLLSRTGVADREHQEVDDIRQAAERAAQLTRQLLAFSRRQKLEPRVFDLVALLREEEGILRRLIPETIRMEVDSAEGPLWVHADPGQLSQVLVNLATNARDAMPDGGTLQISLSRATDIEGSGPHPDPPGLEGRAQPGGAYACLRVRDTGAGMDPTTIERAFDPFFSTKEDGAGTGLGLAIVHGIVTQSGGTVRVTSQPGSGTQFSIYLPETRVAPPVEGPPVEPERSTGASERPRAILLVEDDGAVRSATARMLESLGHRVIECAHPAEARTLWKRSAAEIDVIVSDVILPGATGPRLVAELLATHPVRVLFISGYLDDALKDPLLERAAFLPKPFSRRDLATKLTAVLAAPPVALPSAQRVDLAGK